MIIDGYCEARWGEAGPTGYYRPPHLSREKQDAGCFEWDHRRKIAYLKRVNDENSSKIFLISGFCNWVLSALARQGPRIENRYKLHSDVFMAQLISLLINYGYYASCQTLYNCTVFWMICVQVAFLRAKVRMRYTKDEC